MNEISALFALAIFSALVLFLGWRRRFFDFHFKEWQVPIRFYHVVIAFFIYFILSSIFTNWAIAAYKKGTEINFLTYSSWFNFSLSISICFGLFIYFLFLPEKIKKGILWRPDEKHQLRNDLNAAGFAWLMAFPFVLLIGETLELVVTYFSKLKILPDQIAVKFLKSTFENPSYFVLATICIVILAPLIEEMLFRGFLQTFIRQHLGSKQAILITSVCFSLFHFSSSQGLGNISIIFSLFVLSLYLGYIYEKQGSIFANIFLHAGFNIISVINLYFFGGFTTGVY